MLTPKETRLVLENALAMGVDFAEVFFEDREDVTINYDGMVDGVAGIHIYGAGLYMMLGTRRVYVYTSEPKLDSLTEAVRIGCGLLRLSGNKNISMSHFVELSLTNPCPVKIYPGTVSHAKKIAILKDANKAAHDISTAVKNIKITYFDRDQRIIVANTEGLWAEDRRVTGRIRFIPVVSNEYGTASHFFDCCASAGFEMFESETHIDRLKKTITRMENSITAREAPSARVSVILEGGCCSGTFFHEACGHQLETTTLARGGMFFDRRGEMIASPKVTLIDDGTMPGMYGSSSIDDEGMPRQKNVLIENGILKGFMADRLGALKLKVPRTGSGRRQDYAHAPGARMSNTYIALGTDDEDAMIRDTEEGIFVTEIGGGTGGREFTLFASTAYWIKHGEIVCQVKGAMLLGRGDETMKKIDRVGKKLIIDKDGGSFCGADSGFCATTTSGARIRIAEMVIGGKGGKI